MSTGCSCADDVAASLRCAPSMQPRSDIYVRSQSSLPKCMGADARKDVCATPHNDLALAEADVTYGALARGQHHQRQVQSSTGLVWVAAQMHFHRFATLKVAMSGISSQKPDETAGRVATGSAQLYLLLQLPWLCAPGDMVQVGEPHGCAWHSLTSKSFASATCYARLLFVIRLLGDVLSGSMYTSKASSF